MHYYVTVLTDTCKTQTYVIHTRIYQYTYRIDVFKNGKLIDSSEATSPEPEESVFQSFYKEAHKAMRAKYCTDTPIEISNKKETQPTMPRVAFYEKKSFLKMILAGIFAVGIFLFWYFNMFVYSTSYINMLHGTEKVAYLEKIEPQIHKLSKNCLALAKKERLEDELYTIDTCQTWCIHSQIDEDSCKLFFAYSGKNNKVSLENNISLDYAVLPLEDLELSTLTDTIVQVNNLGSLPMTVSVKKMTLENSQYEEIVQFRHAISHFQIDANEAKKFSLFLEPSYYRQFSKGKYKGQIEFEVKQQDKLSSFVKKFTFEVK